MKRIPFAVVMTLVLSSLPALPARAGVDFGLKAGMSLSQVQADLFDTENRTGFVGGIYGAFGFSPGLALQPEVLFVRKGAQLFSTNVTLGGITFGSIGSTLDIDYVEVPLLLRASLPGAGPLGLRLLAGPVFALETREAITFTGLVGYSIPTDQIKSSDFGMAVGAAAALSSGGMRVVAEGRYTFGLTNVSDLPFGGEVKNGAIYATLGLEFPLGAR